MLTLTEKGKSVLLKLDATYNNELLTYPFQKLLDIRYQMLLAISKGDKTSNWIIKDDIRSYKTKSKLIKEGLISVGNEENLWFSSAEIV